MFQKEENDKENNMGGYVNDGTAGVRDIALASGGGLFGGGFGNNGGLTGLWLSNQNQQTQNNQWFIQQSINQNGKDIAELKGFIQAQANFNNTMAIMNNDNNNARDTRQTVRTDGVVTREEINRGLNNLVNVIG